MFSQIRKRLEDGFDAVEQLAQQSVAPSRPPHQSASSLSSPNPSTENHPQHTRTNSDPRGRGADTAPSQSHPLSTSQLAESALSSIRRSISLQGRSASPHSHPPHQSPSLPLPTVSALPPAERELAAVSRSLPPIEDRLHASFSLGEASNATTPEPPSVPSASPAPPPISPPPVLAPPPAVVEPTSIPLPSSPLQDEFPTIDLALSSNTTTTTSPAQTRSDPPPNAPVPTTPPPLPLDLSTHTHTFTDPLSPTPHRITKFEPPSVAEPEPEPEPEPLAQASSTVVISEVLSSEPESPEVIPIAATKAKINGIDVFGSPSPLILSADPAASLGEGEKTRTYEELQARLKLVEERFAEVSTSFKRLQSEKNAAEKTLKQFTPLEGGITDVEELGSYLQNMTLKVEISANEMKRLSAQIRQQDERLEEVHDIHRLESKSRSEEADKLKKQVEEAESLLVVSSEDSKKQKVEIEGLTAEIEKLKGIAKEEEEKRVKAISLLKTVRQKLVKAEKDKEDVLKDKEVVLKEKEEETKLKERMEAEIARVKGEKERDVESLRTQFERESAGLKEKFDREFGARKSQFELEIITMKASHSKELSTKSTRITSLESSLRSLNEEKDSLFDQLQLRQAELESSQTHLEALENQNKELKLELKEVEERLEARGDSENMNGVGGVMGIGGVDVGRLIADSEAKAEAKVSELRTKLRSLEKERDEAESEWSRNLQSSGREVERLRKELGNVERAWKEEVKVLKERSGERARVEEMEAEVKRLKIDKAGLEAHGRDLTKEVRRAEEKLVEVKEELNGSLTRLSALEQQMEESRTKESQLRTSNKTLREELRKVQSSAALLERQRNPGVGYWASASRVNVSSPGGSNGIGYPMSPTQEAQSPSRPSSPSLSVLSDGGATTSRNSDEEVNLEYLRNVIMQFLEHKEMRPNLVRVLSVILRFTPQETRRLISKV